MKVAEAWCRTSPKRSAGTERQQSEAPELGNSGSATYTGSIEIIAKRCAGASRWRKRITSMHMSTSDSCMSGGMAWYRTTPKRPAGTDGEPNRVIQPLKKASGALYEHGNGVVQDFSQALHWYRMAAQQGAPSAQYLLGKMYEYGRGVAQDYSEAARWFKIAAEHGDVSAQTELGTMYNSGRGVTQDSAEAFRWSLKAAQQGNPYAQSNIAIAYAFGQGVPQNYVQAHMWANLAASTCFWRNPDQSYAPPRNACNKDGTRSDR